MIVTCCCPREALQFSKFHQHINTWPKNVQKRNQSNRGGNELATKMSLSLIRLINEEFLGEVKTYSNGIPGQRQK